MKATEKRLLEEATRKQDEHDRQTTAIQRAKMDAQSQYDAFLADSQRRNDELYKKGTRTSVLSNKSANEGDITSADKETCNYCNRKKKVHNTVDIHV